MNSNDAITAGSYTYKVPAYFDANGNLKETTIEFHDDATNPTKVTSTVTIPAHEKGKIGAIGTIFGGGNAAKVIGNTTVNIGVAKQTVFVTPEAATEANRTKTVLGADIRGNVFGGGNAADVTGNTNVVVGK